MVTAGERQTDDQRRIAPDALIRQAHSLFALAIGAGGRPVHIKEGLLQEALRLHLPDLEPGPAETFLQGGDISLAEAPGEVSSRGRVRNPLGTQSVEIALSLAAPFKVLQTLTAGQEGEGLAPDRNER
jgi:hypothetical protein